MLIARVIGKIWATRKEESLTGLKLLIVQPLNILDGDRPDGAPMVAADLIGAGKGETVLVVAGSSARFATVSDQTTVDAAVVGIVDDKEFDEGFI